jgi:Arc/MetJ-type ribon-helix-helix transcriptional regulator
MVDSGLKISVSLPEEDVEFLDDYAESLGMGSRSAVVQRAVRLLRASGLGPAYVEAWEEWEASGEAEAWDSVVGDGLETSRK